MYIQDDRHWIKACLEQGNWEFASVCTVVTNTYSDDANVITVNGNEIWLRLARTGDTFSVHYSYDGKEFVSRGYLWLQRSTDGSLELPSTLSIVCRSVSKELEGFEDFHFHQLRYTYTSNLLSNGVASKAVQELLKHSGLSTTMNIYTLAAGKAKRDSARLLDKVASNA